MWVAPVQSRPDIQPEFAAPNAAPMPSAGFDDALRSAVGETQPASRTVAKGDTLWRICRDYLSSDGDAPSGLEVHNAVQTVAKANTLSNPNLLRVGQQIDLSAIAPPQSFAEVPAFQPSVVAEAPPVEADPTPETQVPVSDQNAQVVALAPTVVDGPVVDGDPLSPVMAPEMIPFQAPAAPAEPAPVEKPAEPVNPWLASFGSTPPPLIPKSAAGELAGLGGEAPPPVNPHRGFDVSALIQSILGPKQAPAPEPQLVERSPWTNILGDTGRLTSGFGMRKDPFNGRPEMHDGVDIAAKAGTTIYPYQEGVVKYSGWSPGHGKVVIVEHPDGLETVYAHNSKNSVATGQTVTPETPLGEVGSTGRSTGPHLHFEVRKNGKPVDPTPYLTQGSELLHVAEAL